ncbi:MAG TPA: hypothetical protein VKS79_10960 [Gemmataceae bacterium]|nr:hypothetical protein [Gemmataceae bacterium]
MSTAPVPSTPSNHAPKLPAGDRVIRVFQHSSLFYWWPIWLMALLFALVSEFDGTRMLQVSSTAQVEKQADGKYVVSDLNNTKALDERVSPYVDEKLHPRMMRYPLLGTIFVIALILVVVITNVPLRGLWWVVVITIIVLVSVIITIMEWWGSIARGLGDLRIFIGFAGYLTIGLCLLAIWCFSVFIFDRQTYIMFTPGQMKVCEEIGAGEKVYDTAGMQLEKHRDDLFRHWVLGLGSGDMTVRTQAGGQVHEIRMSNVLFVHRKLLAIEDMQREKATVQGD